MSGNRSLRRDIPREDERELSAPGTRDTVAWVASLQLEVDRRYVEKSLRFLALISVPVSACCSLYLVLVLLCGLFKLTHPRLSILRNSCMSTRSADDKQHGKEKDAY